MRRAIIPTPAFNRAARHVTRRQPAIAAAVAETLQLLADDAFDPRLRTHRLKGNLAHCWASSAGYHLRIVFQFVQHEGSEAILLESVGTHDEVY